MIELSEGGAICPVGFVTMRCLLSAIFIIISSLLSGSSVTEDGPSFNPDNTKIAFASSRSGHFHIWTRNIDGTNAKEISRLYHDLQPVWSPDGTKIAFASYGTNELNGPFTIWITNSDGTNPYQFIAPEKNDGDQYPSWSPDGKFIAWTHGLKLWIAKSDGQDPHQLTTKPAKVWEYGAQWSPNSSQIAYIADNKDTHKGISNKIWLIGADGQNQRLLSNGIIAVWLKWSKDGKFLYYNSCDAIMKIDAEGRGPAQKLLDLKTECSHFDISSDEKWIVYDDTGEEASGKLIVKKLN